MKKFLSIIKNIFVTALPPSTLTLKGVIALDARQSHVSNSSFDSNQMRRLHGFAQSSDVLFSLKQGNDKDLRSPLLGGNIYTLPAGNQLARFISTLTSSRQKDLCQF